MTYKYLFVNKHVLSYLTIYILVWLAS